MLTAYSIGVDQSPNHTGVCVLSECGVVLESCLIEPACVELARLVAIRSGLFRCRAHYVQL